jgi:hypothetical protein
MRDHLHRHVLQTIGTSPATWPGGWPGEIEAALLDAVFSVRARYGSRTKGTGVFGAVTRWRDRAEGPADDLRRLAAVDEDELRGATNHGRLSGRSKAAVVIDAAGALVDAGVAHADDLPARMVDARAAYLSVKGCGPVTWAYFRMLLGFEDVKPDTWVMRFVREAVPEVKTNETASQLIHEVAALIGVSPTDLDHAIWRYQRAHSSTSAQRA